MGGAARATNLAKRTASAAIGAFRPERQQEEDHDGKIKRVEEEQLDPQRHWLRVRQGRIARIDLEVIEGCLPTQPVGEESNRVEGEQIQKRGQKKARSDDGRPRRLPFNVHIAKTFTRIGRKAACPKHRKTQYQRCKPLFDLHVSPYI